MQKASIIDSRSALNGKKRDILISKGKIQKIAVNIKGGNAKVIKSSNLCVSIGWMDFRANFRDPGHEYKENLESGLNAAARGGFTAVGLMPSTTPPIDSKADVEYLLNRAKNHLVQLIPYGSLSKDLKGETLSEMYDMFLAGARAFTDDKESVKQAGLMQRALYYVKNFGGLVLSFPYDKTIVSNGQINESVISTRLGLKGIPALAEEIQVTRDIYLTEYTGSRIHIGPVSSPKSVELIRDARKNQLKISSEISSHQLYFSDEDLIDYDSNLKVMPPLRQKADQKALIKGLKDGTIDIISSDHSPEDEENKKLEFDFAAFGISGIETAFAAANTALAKHLNLDELIGKISINPREVLGLELPEITEGEIANLSIFDPDADFIYQAKNAVSLSRNNPFMDKKLKGKVIGVINRGHTSLFE